MFKKDILAYSLIELEEYFIEKKMPKFRAKQVFLHLHKDYVTSFDDMTTLPIEMRNSLSEEFEIYTMERTVRKLVSKIDGTQKYLYELYDGQRVETVLMQYKHGQSICISTQVGCKMGCTFCASTLAGFERNLCAGEMLSQVYQSEKESGKPISNIVLMGIGEPLDNYDEVLKFVKRITDINGRDISIRNITISTCGIVPKINELAEEKLGLTLALSLHAPTDDMRKETMPIANRYSVDETIKACTNYANKTGRRVTYEYALIAGVNDSEEDARKLAKLLKNSLCHVNLIPVNEIKERDYKESSKANMKRFLAVLENENIPATIRRTLGSDISAACGQLRRDEIDRK